ncbi:hypothetical protein L6164_029786 [Bauhinia variegata]|uniref:Uncharacterized protein n=1 Tax=Bauhinia variegata TaxID=167791 RepID=A0ACB9LAD2_BAUVA|nr:hypothetical protein L6164_029786 [Bauhinia variegata]
MSTSKGADIEYPKPLDRVYYIKPLGSPTFPATSSSWFFFFCAFSNQLVLSLETSKVLTPQELANSQGTSEDSDSSNRRLVLTLYEALNSRDADTIVKIVAPDLEWWFHGPPSHQFLMRMLTGEPSSDKFDFGPQSITSFGPTVLVEGCDNGRSISWVHALTITDGIITQIREYFNTALTVTRIGNSDSTTSSGLSSPASSTSEITPAADSHRFPCVWESSVSNRVGKSVPGLVLAL